MREICTESFNQASNILNPVVYHDLVAGDSQNNPQDTCKIMEILHLSYYFYWSSHLRINTSKSLSD